VGETRDLDPAEFVKRLVTGRLEGARIVDVREPEEWERYVLDQAERVPMRLVPVHMQRWTKDEDIYVLCAHGIRSAAVCDYLRQNGFASAVNVAGGLAAVAWLKDGVLYDRV